MGKCRVLHIMNSADVGGISALVLNYYRYIDRSKYQFDFLLPPVKLGPNGFELQKLGCTFYTLPKKSDGLITYCKGLYKFLKENPYNVVHVHHHDTSYVSLFVAMACGVKCRVAQAHSYIAQGETLRFRIRRYVGSLLNDLSSNLRFACNDEAACYLFGKKLKNIFPVTILPNGIEPEKFPFSESARGVVRNEFNIGKDTIVFGIVARLAPEKNHKFLIDVLPEMLKVQKNVRLLIVGSGPLREELVEYAEKKGMSDYVIFAGKRKDLVEMLCAMDVFTLPSFFEGSPVAAVEAAANGLPLVLSSAITKELNFLNNVVYADIKNCHKEWANTIIELSSRGRDKNAVKILNKFGYNICAISEVIATSYAEKLKG